LRTKVEEVEKQFFTSSTEDPLYILELSYSSDGLPNLESACLKTLTGADLPLPLGRAPGSDNVPRHQRVKVTAWQKARA
jgi:hypothetical protein